MKKSKNKASQKPEIEFTASSGNVFRDIGFSDVEADILMTKTKLLSEVADLIDDQGLNQVQAAKQLGVDQTTLSKALNGKLHSVSVERIIEWLNKLGRAVQVTTVKMTPATKHGCFVKARAHA